MKSSTTVLVSALAGQLAVLAGVARGRLMLADLIRWTAKHNPRGTFVLDFAGVEVGSTSFLRESVLAFRDYARAYQPELYPVVANLEDAVREEFNLLLEQRREAMLGCRVNALGVITDPEILGELEAGLEATLDVVRKSGAVTPAEILRGANMKGPALSNRLATLVRLGLLEAISEGKRRAYRFVLAEAGGQGGN